MFDSVNKNQIFSILSKFGAVIFRFSVALPDILQESFHRVSIGP
ncbi:hypothetical protein FH603_4828 [Spirosoma sp. LMG 31447]|uniref:Uncharacterized protein n=1 Tax=Spirosoma utsteinense TaxID=2585773 RepID=A0ABR6WCP4_9BACT|nr:hypothetical protein [Spirosoma utsteinense]